MRYLWLILVVFLFGCEDRNTRTVTETNVNSQNYLMKSEDLALDIITAKLEKGDIEDAKGIEQLINTEPGINNVDLDKDGNVDELTIKEENQDGKPVLAIIAHPKTGEETVVAELSFEKNTETQSVEIHGAYPSYVSGYDAHYYHSTVAGSVIGDMMLYDWMFRPHPLYVPHYSYGMYYHEPRTVMNVTQVTNVRNEYTTKNKIKKAKAKKRPKAYKAKSTGAKKRTSKLAARKASRSKSSSTSSKKKSWGSSSKKKSSWGSKSRKSSWGSSHSRSRSFGGGFKSRRR